MEFAIAYLDKNGTGYADNYPWIVMPPYPDLRSCQKKADAMIREGYKHVTVFRAVSQLDARLAETAVGWDYIKRHQIRCAAARVDLNTWKERTA